MKALNPNKSPSSYHLDLIPRCYLWLTCVELKVFFLSFFMLFNVVLGEVVEFENISPELIKDVSTKFSSQWKNEDILPVLDDMIRYIHTKINYDMVIYKKLNGKYIVEIINSKRISKIHFSGSTFVPVSELRNILGVNEGDILDSNQVLDGAERIRKYYNESGFLNARVHVDLPEASKNNLEAHLDIEEGVPTRVNKISITSESSDLNKKISKLLNKYDHKFFTETMIQEIQQQVKEYFKINGIIQGEVNLSQKLFNEGETSVELIFSLHNVQKYTFDFSGYNQVSRIKLMKLLDTENYNSTNPNVASEMSSKIKNYYLEKGFARVDVRSEEVGTTAFDKKVIFNIQEGPKIIINQIIFQGTYSRSEKYYEEIFLNGASDLTKSRYYNKTQIDESVANFKLELQNQGFLMIQIQNIRTVYSSAKDKVIIYINFDEGPLTVVDTVYFEGNKSINDKVLMQLIGLSPGDPLELNKLEKSISIIKNKYQEEGYLEVSILNEKESLVAYDISNTKAKLSFIINEGPQVSVNSIAIEGNQHTKDNIILIELEFKKGDILTPSKIEESISRLQKTGFFNAIDIKTLEQRTSISDRTVLVKVTEREPGLFAMGIGATNERNGTLRGYTGIGYRNILGTGRGVSARLEGKYNIADIKYPELKVILGYVEPYLFFTRLRGRINVSRSRYVSDFSDKKVTESNQYIYAIEKDFTTHVTGIFEVYNLETFRDFLLSTSETTQELNIASAGPTLDIDYRDNPFLPTRGVFARFNVEYASPPLGSSDTIEYLRATGSVSHYWPIEKNWVWAHNVRLGYLENLSKHEDGGVPFSKKGFILGGRSTIRGFESGTEEVVPNKEDLGIVSDTDVYNLKTNASQFLFKSEIRFPVYGNFHGGVFYDGGSVYIKDLPFKDNYRDSVGVGLRYNTPVGALNMEIGKKLDRKENESDIRYHLSFGTF
ncbi:MAG: BamA/TamA family outer membrane protein [Deltaproteobacteria bacterium]|nr:BamA/TamA family outer membrane protein [Deltaproteobacteria bacterium]